MSNFIQYFELSDKLNKFLAEHRLEINNKDVKSISRAMRDEPDIFQSAVWHMFEMFGVDVVKELKGNMPPYFRYYDDMITTYKVSPSANCVSGSAFFGCRNLKEVWLNDNARFIGRDAFSECISLKRVVFNANNTIEGIDAEAFYHCVSLESILLPYPIKAVDTKAFAYCKKLSRVVLPPSLQYIDSSVFYDCTSLTNINYTGKINNWNNSVIKSSDWAEGSNIKEIICLDGTIECQ
jgi:hypothetical protein